ncbi:MULTISPECIES: cell division regulator GpsB [Alkalihalophilus]|jgi:DivIVA domain-containing protein|uniref:Cell cycle protein GpsB n=3 Tax=Alkalihalophilus TaxID=2893060 RepID=D3G0U1_ALKPO|nr:MULTISPECIES: cell division regulator GpsB [Alkalihalophilus]ADC51253.1 cell division protein GpsB [Alkalihalophilus pseudofirmus OF4]ERN54295.1 cell division protein GpsB [Alkalihalophilus marmarensis DSM 21297]MCM3488286.1 cell division regulator GpsB [Alkalihalophilus marmarensis]MDV2884442.1 cell division regulator GpsB [Alkalihalophilus pseudofirmus]MEC2070930.1 cell division regulator GpsB [Alkalihalophilus marmarensis]
MNNPEVRLSAKEILDKEFKTSMRGYNPDEVDKFLDSVIQDYEAFQKKVAALEQENQKLRREMKQLQERPQRQTAAPTAGSTNYDILQRLSNLEKKVFGSKLYE